jgi:hypothetical protein
MRTNKSEGPTTLEAEHQALLTAVFERADPVLAQASNGHWPDVALIKLVDVLHSKVLRQIADEEHLLFSRDDAQAPFAALLSDHFLLRALIAQLTDLSIQPGPIARLTLLVDEFVTVLLAHLDREGHALTALTGMPEPIPRYQHTDRFGTP